MTAKENEVVVNAVMVLSRDEYNQMKDYLEDFGVKKYHFFSKIVKDRLKEIQTKDYPNVLI